MNEPWSKRHKREFKGCTYSLSNSFAQPLSQDELVQYSEKNCQDLLQEFQRHHSLEYTPNGGSLDLQTEISKLYGSNITSDHILVFPGGQVALQTAALAMARDRHSIVFSPGYQSTIESPLWASNSQLTILERKPPHWQINLTQVEQAIRADTKFMIINEPYNPGGIVMKRELQTQLIALAEKHGIVILCDEVYRLLEHDTNDRIPAMADAYSKGISAVTMSKPFGGCGISIGWLACPNLEIKQRLVDVQYFGTACPSRASELQAMMVLRNSDDILEKRLAIINHNKSKLAECILKHEKWLEWSCPNAGAIAFVKFKGPMSSQQLGAELVQRGISMKPTYCFTSNVTPELESYFRVGFGEIKMLQALEQFEAYIDENQDSWRETMKTQAHV